MSCIHKKSKKRDTSVSVFCSKLFKFVHEDIHKTVTISFIHHRDVLYETEKKYVTTDFQIHRWNFKEVGC